MAKQNGTRWHEVERIFDEALDQDTEQRTAFVAAACDNNGALQHEVESLLAAYQRADGFLASPVAHAAALPMTNGNGHVTPERIGPYRLLRELAQGGMGAVWLAERADDQFHQQVAIKLLKADITRADVRHRFLHERQVLADLNHPNIARLLDGGTAEDGRPYIVLEYIEGQPIDDYCQQKQLSLNERLQLFRQVCAAVQYAHQHLLIHRDLKPANVLVTSDGVPKLLDFGIAKLLQPDLAQSFETLPGTQPMTPAYASPEQVRGEKLTTASDVYSLGVLLYELLTGRSPYQLTTSNFGELVKAICEQEPTRPSAAVTQSPSVNDAALSFRTPHSAFRTLKGDLDSIVLMALRKEPAARYGSVEQFAEDIRRYLAGLPTTARRGTFGYRAMKYVRRNRVPLAAAALVVLSLCGGIFATARQARIALAAQGRAEQEQSKANTQRTRAEAALTTAEDRRRQAEAARNEADQQRNEAETQRTQANEQRALVESQKTLADGQRARAERLVYTSRMGLAMNAWEEANTVRMFDLLNPYLPQAGAPEFRGFEWYHLWYLSHQEERTWLFAARYASDQVAFSAEGKQILTIARRADAGGTLLATEVQFRDAASGQLQKTLELPPSTMSQLTPDRNLLALAEHGGKEVRLFALPGGTELRKLTVTAAPGGLSCMDFTPDGKRLIVGYYNGLMGLYDLETGRELFQIKQHTQRVFTVGVSPDGKQFVSGSYDRTARLWSLADGKEIFLLGQRMAYAQNILFSPDGRIVVVSGSGFTTVWEISSGKELARLRAKGRRMVFTPDGKTLIIGGEDAQQQSAISFIDTASWQDRPGLRGHGNWIQSLAVSPDGQWLASASLDQSAKLWNLRRVPEKPYISDPLRRWGGFNSVALSPDGKRLLVGQGAQVATVWDVVTKKEVMTLRGHTMPPDGREFRFAVAISSDNQFYATGGYTDQHAKIWDAATGAELNSFKAAAPIGALAFSPDGNSLAIASFNQVQLWHRQSGQELRRLTGPRGAINVMRFSKDGHCLLSASADGMVFRWEVNTGKIVREYRVANSSLPALSLSLDGRTFMVGGNDAIARLWEVETGRELLSLKGHSSPISAIAFSPDGRRLVTGSLDKDLRLWDPQTGEELITLKGHAGWIVDNSIHFSPDGHTMYSAEYGRVVRFWHSAKEPEVLARR